MMSLLGLYSFLGAFCSIGYQIVASLLVSDLLKNELIGFHLTVGVFLFGLGLGALRHKFGSSEESVLKQFLKYEIVLTLLGLCLVPLLYLLYSFSYLVTETLLNTAVVFSIFAMLLVLMVGFFSGLEIPVLISLGDKRRLGYLLGINYFGGLLSSLLIPVFMVKAFNFYQIQFLFVLANATLVLLIALKVNSRFLRSVSFGAVGIFIIIAQLLLQNFKFVEQGFLKVYYMGIKIESINASSLKQVYSLVKAADDIIHSRTPYQTIDILDERNSVSNLMTHPFSLYLNRDPQFSQDSWLGYHESMIVGGMNLSGMIPSKILIIGGGDGLLARVLLERFSDKIERIDLVEIDPAIVDLSNQYFPLRRLSQGVLESETVQVHFEDAFEYVRGYKQRYDAILIDLPYPNSFELTRLYSLEFYHAVARILSDTGYAVMDAPIWKPLEGGQIRRPLPQDIIVSTLSAAGLRSIFPFGPIEPFIFFSKQERAVQFNYDSFPEWISNRTFMNLVQSPLLASDIERDKSHVNSVFRPKRFRF